MKKIASFALFFVSFFVWSFIHSGKVYSQTAVSTSCLRLGLPNAVGQCDSNCQAFCPAGYRSCDRNNNGAGAPGSCVVPDRACAWQYVDGTRRTTSGVCCCPNPTSTPVPTITPTSTPTSTVIQKRVSGRVLDVRTGMGSSGARVLIHKVDNKYGFCVGTHYGCNPEYAVTDKNGNWSSTCSGDPMRSVYIKEVQNSIGYIDSNRWPEGAGSSVWDKNTVCFERLPSINNLGPINFYDSKN